MFLDHLSTVYSTLPNKTSEFGIVGLWRKIPLAILKKIGVNDTTSRPHIKQSTDVQVNQIGVQA